MTTKFTKSQFKAYVKQLLHEELLEARQGNNPTPPSAIEIVSIEPQIQKNHGGKPGTVRHYDLIIYTDPISGLERRVMVFEENPGFGKYFGWGDKYSADGWNYAAYDYDGNLVPGVDPSQAVTPVIKSAMTDIAHKINNP